MLYVISGFIIGLFFGMGLILIVINTNEDFSFKKEISNLIIDIEFMLFCIKHRVNPFKITYYDFICKLNNREIEHYLKIFPKERREKQKELIKYCKDTQKRKQGGRHDV